MIDESVETAFTERLHPKYGLEQDRTGGASYGFSSINSRRAPPSNCSMKVVE